MDPVEYFAKEHAGIPFLFPVQRCIIAGILDSLADKSTVARGQLSVMPTGAGKSLCFQIPIALHPRPALVLYPLLALLQDQQRRFNELGISSAIVRGGQTRAERETIWQNVRDGKIRAVLTNPESMIQENTLKKLRDLKFGHMVVDEAHCVCEWGKTFRPTYLEIPKIQRDAAIPVLSAFTATAGPEVLTTVKNHLFPDYHPAVYTGTPDRPNMGLRVMPVINKDAAIRQMFADTRIAATGRAELPMWFPGAAIPKPAIVFCNSRKGCESLAKKLARDHSDTVNYYHAGIEREQKTAMEDWFFSSSDGILCSTTAYGMGVDKKNIRTVIHRDLPQSIESYMQEAGRAGRDRQPSQAILLISPSDLQAPARQNDDFQAKRLQQLIDWVQEPGCRRISLLRRMGCSPEPCFGCSSCIPSPRPAENSYWHRHQVLMTALLKHARRVRSQHNAVLQWISREFEWNRFSLPSLAIRRLPQLPEWNEAEIHSVVQETVKSARVSRAFFQLMQLDGSISN